MRSYRIILIIGFIEILIGGVTIFTNLVTVLLSTNPKTPNVLFFVLVTGAVSTLIGIGILKLKRIAYLLLIYFSSVILLTKFLIFIDVIHLNGALETAVPAPLKRMISMIYHGFVIYYLSHKDIKNIFHD